MEPIDFRAYAYCDHCDSSINFYKTDLNTFEQSRQRANEYISKILGEKVEVGIKDVIMAECTIYRTMQLLQEFMFQLQQQGKEPNVDQTQSQTYIIDDERCALDLKIDGKIWFSIISGKCWQRNGQQKISDKNVKTSTAMDILKSLFNFK